MLLILYRTCRYRGRTVALTTLSQRFNFKFVFFEIVTAVNATVLVVFT